MGVLLLLLLFSYVWDRRPRVTEEQIRQTVQTTLQRETPQSFLVTGSLDIVGSAAVSRRTVLLPGLLNVPLSTDRVAVRVPARVTYGFDIRGITGENIRVENDSIVRVTIPDLRVQAVESNLGALEIKADRGWVRLDAEQIRRLESRALRNVDTALRAQAAAHLRDSVQPRLNTARALESMLRPAVEAAGLKNAVFRFQLASGVVMER